MEGQMSCGKANWQLLKDAGEALTAEGRSPFTRGQLMERVWKFHPGIGRDTLNPMIQGMTVNLRGGAPGAVGKNVFRSVGRGMFELSNGAKAFGKEPISTPPVFDESPSTSSDNKPDGQETDILIRQNESEIRDFLMQLLFHTLGKEGTWRGGGVSAEFELCGGYKCYAERPLSYDLPGGQKLTHRSDILISSTDGRRHVSIEIKHESAVTDQFKCRAYDIMHLRQTYGKDLVGILVYVKTSTGLSVERAKAICYSFDHFVAVPFQSRHNPTVWNELISAIQAFVSNS